MTGGVHRVNIPPAAVCRCEPDSAPREGEDAAVCLSCSLLRLAPEEYRRRKDREIDRLTRERDEWKGKFLAYQAAHHISNSTPFVKVMEGRDAAQARVGRLEEALREIINLAAPHAFNNHDTYVVATAEKALAGDR